MTEANPTPQPNVTVLRVEGDSIRVQTENQVFNEAKGGMDITVVQTFALPREQWLHLLPGLTSAVKQQPMEQG